MSQGIPSVTYLTEYNQSEKIALIALGANLPSKVGAPEVTLRAATQALAESGGVIRATSYYYSTPCFPEGAGPDYVNAVLAMEWRGSAAELLGELHNVEAVFQRTREVRWGMRTLDLDLLAMGETVFPDAEVWSRWRGLPLEEQMQKAPQELILPHPRLQDRGFVLVPLCDVAPDWIHPVLKVSAAQMLASLPASETRGVKPL